MVSFGENLKTAREAKGLNQGQLAKLLNVTRPLVSMWEHGKAKPSLSTLQLLQKTLGTNFMEILDQENAPTKIQIALDANQNHLPVYKNLNRGEFILSDVPGKTHITVDGNLNPSCFAYLLNGDSMAPAFNEGDIIIVDPQAKPRTGHFVLVSFAGKPLLREYRLRGVDPHGNVIFDATPVNPLYPTTTSSATNVGTIHGVVVEHRRYFT